MLKAKKMRNPRPEHWLAPGTPTFTTFCAALDRQHRAGEISATEALRRARRQVGTLIFSVMGKLGVRDRDQVDDLVHVLIERLATMNAVTRYNPSRGKPQTFLKAILRLIIKERFFRRPSPPVVVSSDLIEHVAVDADPKRVVEQRELLDQLRAWLDKLSAGEIRALVDEYGPLFEYSPPIRRRRSSRCIDPDALPRSIEILRRLSGGER